MTPVLCLDPVSASAVAAGLTTAVGLGPLVCARVVRRRFVSESGRPGVHTTAEWDAFTATLTDEQHEALSDEAGRRGMSRSKVARIYGVKDTCPDCNGTGLVQPSGPQTMLIGATADMSDDLVYDYQDHLAAVDGPADVVWTSIGPHWGWHLAIRPAGEEWTSSNTTYRPIHPASILGTATVAIPPIYDEPPTSSEQAVWIDVSTGSPLMICWNGNEWEELPEYRDRLSAALPFGSWEPGGLAAIFTDLTPRIDTTGDLWRCSCPVDCCRGIGPDPGGCGWCWAKETEDPCPSAAAPIGPLSWSDAPTSPCITTIDLKENAA